MAEIPKGFDCSACGKHHAFGSYVAAHWRDLLTHTCECGKQHAVCMGVARPIEQKKKRKTKQAPEG